MLECHSYFDESGDRGTRASSSDHLILSGFTVSVSDEPVVLQAIEHVRAEFKLPPDAPLHFSKLRHEKRLRWAEVVGSLPLTSFLVLLCKRGQTNSPIHADRIYNWLVRLLIERCSWYCKESGRRTSVTFEHPKGYQVKKMKEYMTKLRSLETAVSWPNVHLPVRFGAKSTHPLLQVADCLASAAWHAFQPQFGHIEDRYLKLAAPHLWRRNGRVLSYGVKVHPALGRSGCPTDHSWVSAL